MTSMDGGHEIDRKIKQDIVVVLKNLYRRGLISALSGNISVRIPYANRIWITPSGVYKAMLKVDDLVKIDLDGNVLEGRNRPSSEWRLHTAIYRARHDVYAIVHTHNLAVLTLDSLGVDIDSSTLIESRYYIKGVAYVPEAEPGSEELAKLVAEKASVGVNLVILKRHGVVAMGRNLYEAEAAIESIEDVALVQLYSLIVKTLLKCIKQ